MCMSTQSFLACIILIFLVEYPDCRLDVHVSLLGECKLLVRNSWWSKYSELYLRSLPFPAHTDSLTSVIFQHIILNSLEVADLCSTLTLFFALLKLSYLLTPDLKLLLRKKGWSLLRFKPNKLRYILSFLTVSTAIWLNFRNMRYGHLNTTGIVSLFVFWKMASSRHS